MLSGYDKLFERYEDIGDNEKKRNKVNYSIIVWIKNKMF